MTGKQFRRLREAAGMSRAEVAVALGTTLWRLETLETRDEPVPDEYVVMIGQCQLDRPEIARRLCARLRSGLSQQAVAVAVGVSQSVISRVAREEGGARATLQVQTWLDGGEGESLSYEPAVSVSEAWALCAQFQPASTAPDQTARWQAIRAGLRSPDPALRAVHRQWASYWLDLHDGRPARRPQEADLASWLVEQPKEPLGWMARPSRSDD